MLLAPGWVPVFPGCRQSCDGAQALIRQQVFKRAQTHLPEGELNDLAFGHVSMCPQLQHRGLRGLLQDLASPKRLPAKTLFTRGVHVELVVSAGIEPASSSRRGALPIELRYRVVAPPWGGQSRPPLQGEFQPELHRGRRSDSSRWSGAAFLTEGLMA